MSEVLIQQTKWKELSFSKNDVIKAGEKIIADNITKEDEKQAKIVIDNWRASHGYPLHVIYCNLRRRFGKRDGFVVAERIKRLDSIIKKLKRRQTMSLWRMHDLGGCRVVVPTIQDVYKCASEYKNSNIKHNLIKPYDYIETPKEDGYRCLHHVYQFQGKKGSPFNRNMKIEIQFRTHLQHLWATAVETIDIFTEQSLKFGGGKPEYKRFFVLMSSLLAMEEGTTIAPNTPTSKDEILLEIKSLDKEHRILDTLKWIRTAASHVLNSDDRKLKPGYYYILKLDYDKRMLRIFAFKPSEFEKANEVYNKLEEAKKTQNIDVVLTRATSFQTLKSAYPNYFLDIGEFVDIAEGYLLG